MTATTGMPTGGFTYADLHAMPDDGNRYEIIDVSLIVTPAPAPRHQIVVAALHLLVHSACPDDLRVLFAPLDVKISDTTVLQPDLLVAPRSSFSATNLPGAPLLAVEVLSPSTRHIDLGLKRSRYEAAGCSSFWVVDPEVPSVTAWDLLDGVYVEVGQAEGRVGLALDRPFPVRVVPADLLD